MAAHAPRAEAGPLSSSDRRVVARLSRRGWTATPPTARARRAPCPAARWRAPRSARAGRSSSSRGRAATRVDRRAPRRTAVTDLRPPPFADQRRARRHGERRNARRADGVAVLVDAASVLRLDRLWRGGRLGLRVGVSGRRGPGRATDLGSFWPGQVASTRAIASCSAWVTHASNFRFTATWRATQSQLSWGSDTADRSHSDFRRAVASARSSRAVVCVAAIRAFSRLPRSTLPSIVRDSDCETMELDPGCLRTVGGHAARCPRAAAARRSQAAPRV